MEGKGRAVLLGGCGSWGRRVLEELLKSNFFSYIAIGDINIQTAKKLAAELGGNGVILEAQHVDAGDPQRLAEVMRKGDVVVNLISPYTKYCFNVVKTAIEIRVNYIDICENWQTTRHILDALNHSAMEAGITVLMGVGASPGLVNILARVGADQLDEVSEVHTAFVSVLGISSPLTWVGRLRAVGSEVPIYKNGELISVRVHNNIEKVHLLEPGVVAEIHPVEHSPMITIPRFIKGVKVVTVKGGFYPIETNRFMHMVTGLGLNSDENITIDGVTKPMVEFLSELCNKENVMKVFRGGREASERWSAYLVKVKGQQAEKEVTISYQLYNMRAADRTTTLPVVLGAQMLVRGDILQKGVLAPEALDPKRFMSEILKIEGVTCREVKETVV